MTFIESIGVDLTCDWRSRLAPATCYAQAVATIVSTVEGGDRVLFPIGWQAVANEGFEGGEGLVGALCPKHAVRKERP